MKTIKINCALCLVHCALSTEVHHVRNLQTRVPRVLHNAHRLCLFGRVYHVYQYPVLPQQRPHLGVGRQAAVCVYPYRADGVVADIDHAAYLRGKEDAHRAIVAYRTHPRFRYYYRKVFSRHGGIPHNHDRDVYHSRRAGLV